jgi:hypothetical protein
MKPFASLSLLVLAACSSQVVREPRPKLAQPSGLVQVSIVSRGLE